MVVPNSAEIVVATGSPVSGNMWVICPGNLGATHWTSCPTYATGWGSFDVTWVESLSSGVIIRTETYEDEDGDGVYDYDDLCDDESGDESYAGYTAKTYCLTIDEAFETKCVKWATSSLSLLDLGIYYARLVQFAEAGCGNNATIGRAWP